MVEPPSTKPSHNFDHILRIDYKHQQENSTNNTRYSKHSHPAGDQDLNLAATLCVYTRIHGLLIVNKKVHIVFPNPCLLCLRACELVNIRFKAQIFCGTAIIKESILTESWNYEGAFVL